MYESDMGPRLEAVLFDMDGTLIDSERWWFQAETEYCARFDTEWTNEDSKAVIGAAFLKTADRLKWRSKSEESLEEIRDYILERVRERIGMSELPWLPGIFELIERSKDLGLKIGLVTSSPQFLVGAVESALPEGFFDVVVSGDDVTESKPHPEPYLKAMEALGVRPENTVVLEDSPTGIRSALDSGAHVVAIPCTIDFEPELEASVVRSAVQLEDSVLQTIVSGERVNLF